MTRKLRPRLQSRAPLWVGIGCLGVTLLIYLQTLAPGLVKADGGELQFVLPTLGVAHPTGYPLYTLVGWLWIQIIPLGSIAWRVNLLSAVCGAVAVALVYGSVYRLTRRVLPSLAGALFLAFSPVFWALSSTTEVYALHALFVAATLFVLLLWRDADLHRFRFLVILALVYGLSLSHHRTMLLLAPGMLLFFLLERPKVGWHERSCRRKLVQRGVLLGVVFLLGLLPYLHIFIHELRRNRTMERVVFDVILGGDFAFFLGFRPDPLRIIWGLPKDQVGLAGLVLAAGGLAWLIWRQRSAAWLLLATFLATMAFCLFYQVPDIQDFMIPTTVILAIWAGSSAGLLELLPSRLASRRGNWLRWTIEAILLLVALLSLGNYALVNNRVAEIAGGIEEQARATMAYPFEPGATVLGDWELTTAARYLRVVEGMESDVMVIPARLGQEKGCSRLLEAAESGGTAYVAPEVQLTRLPDGYLLSSASPYLAITEGAAHYTELGRALHPQLALEGAQQNGGLLVLRWQVTGSPLEEEYTTYAHFFDANDQPLGQQDKGTGAEQTCWYPTTAWPVNEVIQDLFVVPPGTTTVRVGAYTVRDGEFEMLGTDTTIDLQR
ncbi:DUF2723 domain-containing protein [Chloroflexota bacterium]